MNEITNYVKQPENRNSNAYPVPVKEESSADKREMVAEEGHRVMNNKGKPMGTAFC